MPLAWLISTNPNSPAWASARPVRSATPVDVPNNFASPTINANFNSTGTDSSNSTSHQ